MKDPPSHKAQLCRNSDDIGYPFRIIPAWWNRGDNREAEFTDRVVGARSGPVAHGVNRMANKAAGLLPLVIVLPLLCRPFTFPRCSSWRRCVAEGGLDMARPEGPHHHEDIIVVIFDKNRFQPKLTSQSSVDEDQSHPQVLSFSRLVISRTLSHPQYLRGF